MASSLPPATFQQQQQPQLPTTTTTFHRRPLPPPAVAFSSSAGQRLFAEALAAGSMGCFFRLIEQFHTQDEPSFCGLGTLTMVLNAMNVDPGRTWKGPWRWFRETMLDCCEPLERIQLNGITFIPLACLARCNGAFVETHRADESDGDLEAFRRAVCASCCEVTGCAEEEGYKPLKVLVVSYSRKQFRQTGDGHYSPIGGYHAALDKVLVLDVARFKHPPHWVPLVEMWESMRRLDPETGLSRGFMLLSRKPGALCSSWLSLSIRDTTESGAAHPVVGSLVNLPEAFAAALTTWQGDLPRLPADGKLAAAEVLRRAFAFCDSPAMPLSVVCRQPQGRPESATGCCKKLGQPSPAASPEGRPELAAGEQAAANEALRQVLQALGQAGAAMDRALSPLPEAPVVLAVDNLRVALLLALDLSLWERALSPGSAPRAAPPPAATCSTIPAAATTTAMALTTATTPTTTITTTITTAATATTTAATAPGPGLVADSGTCCGPAAAKRARVEPVDSNTNTNTNTNSNSNNSNNNDDNNDNDNPDNDSKNNNNSNNNSNNNNSNNDSSNSNNNNNNNSNNKNNNTNDNKNDSNNAFAAAWTCLKPLLQLEALPEALRMDVAFMICSQKGGQSVADLRAQQIPFTIDLKRRQAAEAERLLAEVQGTRSAALSRLEAERRETAAVERRLRATEANGEQALARLEAQRRCSAAAEQRLCHLELSHSQATEQMSREGPQLALAGQLCEELRARRADFAQQLSAALADAKADTTSTGEQKQASVSLSARGEVERRGSERSTPPKSPKAQDVPAEVLNASGLLLQPRMPSPLPLPSASGSTPAEPEPKPTPLGFSSSLTSPRRASGGGQFEFASTRPTTSAGPSISSHRSTIQAVLGRHSVASKGGRSGVGRGQPDPLRPVGEEEEDGSPQQEPRTSVRSSRSIELEPERSAAFEDHDTSTFNAGRRFYFQLTLNSFSLYSDLGYAHFDIRFRNWFLPAVLELMDMLDFQTCPRYAYSVALGPGEHNFTGHINGLATAVLAAHGQAVFSVPAIQSCGMQPSKSKSRSRSASATSDEKKTGGKDEEGKKPESKQKDDEKDSKDSKADAENQIDVESDEEEESAKPTAKAKPKKKEPDSAKAAAAEDGDDDEESDDEDEKKKEPSTSGKKEKPKLVAASVAEAKKSEEIANALLRQGVPLVVSSCKNKTISDIVKGTFHPHGINHGKIVYKKKPEPNDDPDDLEVLIFYWDERDGPDLCGWWFGPSIGGQMVWAYHPSRQAATPPSAEWNVPHDKSIDNSFTVTADQSLALTLAKDGAKASEPQKAAGKDDEDESEDESEDDEKDKDAEKKEGDEDEESEDASSGKGEKRKQGTEAESKDKGPALPEAKGSAASTQAYFVDAYKRRREETAKGRAEEKPQEKVQSSGSEENESEESSDDKAQKTGADEQKTKSEEPAAKEEAKKEPQPELAKLDEEDEEEAEDRRMMEELKKRQEERKKKKDEALRLQSEKEEQEKATKEKERLQKEKEEKEERDKEEEAEKEKEKKRKRKDEDKEKEKEKEREREKDREREKEDKKEKRRKDEEKERRRKDEEKEEEEQRKRDKEERRRREQAEDDDRKTKKKEAETRRKEEEVEAEAARVKRAQQMKEEEEERRKQAEEEKLRRKQREQEEEEERRRRREREKEDEERKRRRLEEESVDEKERAVRREEERLKKDQVRQKQEEKLQRKAEERRRKAAGEPDAEEKEIAKRQQAVKSVTSCFQGLSEASLENFGTLKVDFEKVMASVLPETGGQREELKAEGERLYAATEQRVQKEKQRLDDLELKEATDLGLSVEELRKKKAQDREEQLQREQQEREQKIREEEEKRAARQRELEDQRLAEQLAREKEEQERRAAEAKAKREQEATLSVLKGIQKLSDANPDNFAEMSAGFEEVLRTEMPDTGEQLPMLKVEADRVYGYAKQYVQQLTEQRREAEELEQKRRAELQQREASGRKHLEEFLGLLQAAETEAVRAQGLVERLLQIAPNGNAPVPVPPPPPPPGASGASGGPAVVPIPRGSLAAAMPQDCEPGLRAARSAEQSGALAATACDSCFRFLEQHRNAMLEVETLRDEAAMKLDHAVPRMHQARAAAAEAVTVTAGCQERLRSAAAPLVWNKKFADIFRKYDQDEDGLLSRGEISNFAKLECGFALPKENLERIFQQLVLPGALGLEPARLQQLRTAVGVARYEARCRLRKMPEGTARADVECELKAMEADRSSYLKDRQAVLTAQAETFGAELAGLEAKVKASEEAARQFATIAIASQKGVSSSSSDSKTAMEDAAELDKSEAAMDVALASAKAAVPAVLGQLRSLRQGGMQIVRSQAVSNKAVSTKAVEPSAGPVGGMDIDVVAGRPETGQHSAAIPPPVEPQSQTPMVDLSGQPAAAPEAPQGEGLNPAPKASDESVAAKAPEEAALPPKEAAAVVPVPVVEVSEALLLRAKLEASSCSLALLEARLLRAERSVAGEARSVARSRALHAQEELRLQVASQLRRTVEQLGGKVQDLFQIIAKGADTASSEEAHAFLKENNIELERSKLDRAFLGYAREASATEEAVKISREDFSRVLRVYYKVVKVTGLTDNLAVEQSAQIRPLEVGEIVEAHAGPLPEPSSKEVQRVQARALRDGSLGWITVSSSAVKEEATEGETKEAGAAEEGAGATTSSSFLVLGGSVVRVLRPGALEADAPGMASRMSREGEVLEVLDWQRSSAAVTHLKVKARMDGLVAWVAMEDSAGMALAAC
ncbi:unnamed protein product [Polarella glacialis]|uniref:glutathione gamma-glutamylcysteinyltransferase n=1 Tax=Polarella glacialis TaxID=89957 RepID=A0A813G175_POLGL|nr:unnamed protein product [Polarella glacialis]